MDEVIWSFIIIPQLKNYIYFKNIIEFIGRYSILVTVATCILQAVGDDSVAPSCVTL